MRERFHYSQAPPKLCQLDSPVPWSLFTKLVRVFLFVRAAVSSFGWSMTYVTESNRVGRLGPMGATEVSGKDPHRNAWDTALAHNPLSMPHLV